MNEKEKTTPYKQMIQNFEKSKKFLSSITAKELVELHMVFDREIRKLTDETRIPTSLKISTFCNIIYDLISEPHLIALDQSFRDAKKYIDEKFATKNELAAVIKYVKEKLGEEESFKPKIE